MKQYDINQIAKITSLLLLISFLTFASGFLLGSMHKSNNNQSSVIKIEQNPSNINVNNIINQDLSQFVASRNSDIFYPIDCSSANNIKEENKVYFETRQEAIKNGFRASSNC